MLHFKVLFTPRVKSELTVPQTRMGKTPRLLGRTDFNLGQDVSPGLCWANTAAQTADSWCVVGSYVVG